MSVILHCAIAFSGTSASDLLRSSSNGVYGIPLKAIARARLGTRRRDFMIVTKLRKVKKHEYPWPDDPDPNVKGGVLSHLSHFKPLKEKPKPVTLDFEKPLLDLEKKIIDVRKMANETGLDFTDQIISLENKYQQALKDLYTHLTPIQRVSIARHPNRPTFLDHIFNITEKFVELHGDRAGYDDPAIVTGIGTIDERKYMFIGHQKGRNTKENIQRNFGMPTPHGYRKALRMMRYADHHGFPIVTFIDTPGAFADLKSEELGQGEAIAQNLRTMFGLKIPIVSIVIGEGGSGGALAIGCGNKLLMLENAVFYVASPEACAAILWKSAKAAPKAAEKLKITAKELCKLEIADGIIPEPLGGAHSDPSWTSQQIKDAINESMDELMKMDTEQLLEHRRLKFRKIGGFEEGVPEDPDMKTEDEPVLPSGDSTLQGEVERLKEQISKAKESSSSPPELAVNEMIKKLEREVNLELAEAVKAIGLEGRVSKVQEELVKLKKSQDQPIHPILIDKIEKLRDEIKEGLSAAPNYASLDYKMNLLKELSAGKSPPVEKNEDFVLKNEINQAYKKVMSRPDVKEKIDALKTELASSGISTVDDMEDGLKEKIAGVKNEIRLEVVNAVRSLGLDIHAVESSLDLKAKVQELKRETDKEIEKIVNSSPDLKYKIGMLRLEIAKAGEAPDPESKKRIESLEQHITQRIEDALSSSGIAEKHKKLRAEIFKTVNSSGGLDGSLKTENQQGDGSEQESIRPEADLGANHGHA